MRNHEHLTLPNALFTCCRLLSVLLMASIGAAFTQAAARELKRPDGQPNILLILADDLNRGAPRKQFPISKLGALSHTRNVIGAGKGRQRTSAAAESGALLRGGVGFDLAHGRELLGTLAGLEDLVGRHLLRDLLPRAGGVFVALAAGEGEPEVGISKLPRNKLQTNTEP